MTPVEQAVGAMWTGNADPLTMRLAGHAMIGGTMRVNVRCQTATASWDGGMKPLKAAGWTVTVSARSGGYHQALPGA